MPSGAASLPAAVREYIAAQGWGEATGSVPAGGGCINNGQALNTRRGPRLFLKTNDACPPDMFPREAEGLAALAEAPGAPRVPRTLLAGPDFLLLEYLPSAPAAPDSAAAFGEAMARLHNCTAAQFGFDHDNYLGLTPQPNPRLADGWDFYAEHRLLHQGRLARRAGRLPASSLKRLEYLAARLRDLVPEQPASLIHGDLWSGNQFAGPDGHICLIDPAAHYGWAEADLAMTALFGRLPDTFFAAYQAVRPLAPGWRERFDLYNLYHLLNHLNLFGSSYLSSVEATLDQFTG